MVGCVLLYMCLCYVSDFLGYVLGYVSAKNWQNVTKLVSYHKY